MNVREVLDRLWECAHSGGLREYRKEPDLNHAFQDLEKCLPTIDEMTKAYEKARWEQTKKSFSGKSVYNTKERMEAIHDLMVKKVRGEEK